MCTVVSSRESQRSVDLSTLLERATGGLAFNGEQIFRPSWFYQLLNEQLLNDPFWLGCE